MDLNERLIHLHHCRGIAWRSIQMILMDDPLLKNIFTKNFSDWQEILPIPLSKLQIFYQDLHSFDTTKQLNMYRREAIHCLSIFDHEYPDLLKQICDPPWILYYKGNKQLFTELMTIAVVGTRKPTAYGIECTNRIVADLAKKDYTIVSGMADGIDAKAHIAALKAGGKTIAILGGGIKQIYPRKHEELARNIMKYGLLVSEVPPNLKAEPWMFPMRNRIISGWCRGVFVIEAKKKSGSLITAQSALEQGRDVFALPGSILSEQSLGTNQLIQEGAKLVFSSTHIDEEYEWSNRL